MTCLVFKTTCVDRGNPLREGAFSFTRTMLFPPLDKRNTRDEAKGLRVTSERCVGELGVRCLSSLNRGQDSPATVSDSALPANNYCFYPTTLRPATRAKRRREPTNKHAPPTDKCCRWGVAVCLCGLSVRAPSPARGQRAAPSAACPRGRSRRCGGHGYRVGSRTARVSCTKAKSSSPLLSRIVGRVRLHSSRRAARMGVEQRR